MTEATARTPPPIAIRLDDRPAEVAAGTTLAALVASLGHAPAAVATAVNGRFVARDRRHARVLQAGDAVLLFQPITGG
jgi:sulfur carrier protein